MIPSGLLLIDKPTGPTSHDVVHKLRKILKTREVGHAGTLDPLASGLLVALIGEGTKLSPYITDGDKGYRVTVRLGATSDTQDRVGKVQISENLVVPSLANVETALGRARGALDLAVPIYSAVKVDGKKLYEYARAGEAAPEIRRTMDFFKVGLVRYDFPLLEVDLRCSKGSFVRAWSSYVGELLGTGGLVEELRRTFSEPFVVEHALTLDDLEARFGHSELAHAFYPMDAALPSWGRLLVQGEAERLIRNGQIPKSLQPQILRLALDLKLQDGLCLLSEVTGQLLAIATPYPSGPGVKIQRVFL